MVAELPTKRCPTCGRDFAWRKKWQRCWDSVRFCSDRCRRRKGSHDDRELEAGILAMLGRRATGASICPSEVAREQHPDDWRDWMPRVRDAARRLADAGTIELLEAGVA